MATKKAKRNPFREAKRFLWNGVDREKGREVQFICWALEEIGWVSGTAQAKRMVENRLGGLSTVSSFLWNHKQVRRKQLTSKNVQFYRHRWLDHLADEWDRGVRK